jgi:RNA polymerase sigma-70 factor (ECF subfamily)
MPDVTDYFHASVPVSFLAGSSTVRGNILLAPGLIVAIHRGASDPTSPPDGPETEAELYRACEKYRQELREFFASHAHSNAVDDLMQEVSIRLLRARPTEPIQDPRLYMYQIAWNELRRNHERWWQDRKRQSFLPPLKLRALSENVVSLWVDNSSEVAEEEQLAEALEQLPVAWQTAFLRKNRDGWSYKEIAAELNVTPHTVKKYIGKALAHFREYFVTSKTDARQRRSVDEA